MIRGGYFAEQDKAKRDQYWDAIRAMRLEYLEEFNGKYDITMRPRIDYWANQKYGFQMDADGEGSYTTTYTVTDPKKFMLFQIKYMR